MTNKLSGRYCFEKHWSDDEWSEDGSFYCIPIELKNKFKKMTEDVLSRIWDLPQDEFYQKVELFNSTFKNYRLNKPIDQYNFTDLKEIEE